MAAVTRPPALDRSIRQPARGLRVLTLLVCCCVPVLLTLERLISAARAGDFAVDFHYHYWASGHAVLHGQSPLPPATPEAVFMHHAYPAGPYPAPVAVLFAPLGLIPAWLADVLFTGIVAASVFLALHLLGVRDWRCYGAVFLWAPVAAGIQTANLTILLAVGIAAVWRLRHRLFAPALIVGTLVALKLFVWPLVVWLVATRRYSAAACSAAVASTITLVSWAIVDFSALPEYPHVARIFARYYETSAYTPFALLLKLGFSAGPARAASLLVGVVAIAAVFVAARRKGGEPASFTLALAAALLWTPIAWLHYFTLLIVPLALFGADFSPLWLLPAILLMCPAGAPPSAAWEFALPFVISALTLFALSRPRNLSVIPASLTS